MGGRVHPSKVLQAPTTAFPVAKVNNILVPPKKKIRICNDTFETEFTGDLHATVLLTNISFFGYKYYEDLKFNGISFKGDIETMIETALVNKHMIKVK